MNILKWMSLIAFLICACYLTQINSTDVNKLPETVSVNQWEYSMPFPNPNVC